MRDHYDIGIVGWWYNNNYGANLTYFALNKVLNNLGYSSLMLHEATGLHHRKNWGNEPQIKFAKKHYATTAQIDYKNMKSYNEVCDIFLVGSDQLWNSLIGQVNSDCFLDFVDDNHPKIAYGTSFGNRGNRPRLEEELKLYKKLLNRFNSISVREDYAVDIANNLYGVQATHVIDPVFLIDKKEYEFLADDADIRPSGDYLLAFLLDITEEKKQRVIEIAKKLNKKIVVVTNPSYQDNNNLDYFFGKEDVELLPYKDNCIENFLYAYKNTSYVVTDSFHGTCFSYIFKKNFSVFLNYNRGADRFISLLNMLQLQNRVTSTVLGDAIDLSNIDFTNSETIINNRKKESMCWLINALSIKPSIKLDNTHIPSELKALHENCDFIKIRTLVTLLHNYGIKHIVLSPGGRDVPIIRMFEYNENYFKLHRVTDERSAAYYGLGLATQLRQPVACVCTSGTAVSNYLPAVTEAYYTGIPLILITADRYGIFLNHGEDQTIPQKHIFDGVIKKSISLPETTGYYPEYQTRRDISDCILEATHNGNGPVHINVPINNISIGANVAHEHWKLLPFIHPHILRASFLNGPESMLSWLDCLKQSQRIMLVYGQNASLTEQQKKWVDLFTERFNCVVLTDHLSNYNNKYCLSPFNMLNNINQETFNNELAPDILITVGGKRLMNDPLTFKVRNCNKGIRHWSVTPDGKIKDFYFKLTSVIESSQDYFFKWFADNAAESKNNEVYFNKWLDFYNKYNTYRPINSFNAHYIQRALCKSLPANSVLHLGVGQSFFDIRRYTLNKNIEVFCNMGTNGIDGCTSTFMGQCAIEKNKLCVLIVGDLSFFYDMNSIWNKELSKNIRILLVNNNGTDLLRSHNLKAVSSVHNTIAEGWVKSTGFDYISARTPEEFDKNLPYFLSDKPNKALFFEVLCE